MFLFPLLKLKEINLITLWSEKPCLFDVTLSDYSNRLKKDCVSINSCLRPQFSIVPPFRTLPGVAKLRQQPTFFFRFAVAILFVYIGSHNFQKSLDGPRGQGWSPTLSPAKKIAKSFRSDQIRRDRRVKSLGVSSV